MTVARFDPLGKHIFVGTSSGSLLVFNTRTKTVSPHVVGFCALIAGSTSMVDDRSAQDIWSRNYERP